MDTNDDRDKKVKEKIEKLMKELYDEQMRLHPEIYDKEIKENK